MTIKTQLVNLMRKGWVTPVDALYEAGCLSLSQRVGELQRDGVVVLKQWRALPNGKRVMSYRIAK